MVKYYIIYNYTNLSGPSEVCMKMILIIIRLPENLFVLTEIDDKLCMRMIQIIIINNYPEMMLIIMHTFVVQPE